MKHEPLHRGIKQGMLFSLLCFLFSIAYAQNTIPPEVRKKLQEQYNNMKKPEISSEKFLKANAHVYMNTTASASKTVGTLAVTDTYCSNQSTICDNGDFESGLDQNEWTGAYGIWYNDLYPDPFSATYGFSSGPITDAAAHQTIVDTADGVDPTVGIPVAPSNGEKQALRLGNAFYGAGFEILAKTITVTADESILSFYYAVVFEDPQHFEQEQPAFSVRVYDCATGNELTGVCDLGNGANIAVSDATNPFFQDTVAEHPLYPGSGYTTLIAYRDWSLAQVNLSKHIGKTVTVIFTNKDCTPAGHFGYTYLDNIFSSKCKPVDPGGPCTTVSPGTVSLDDLKTDTCGAGKICVKYALPIRCDSSEIGSGTISLDIYQNSSLTVIKTLKSPTLTKDSSYCFSIDPSTLGLDASLGGFDFVIRANFTLDDYEQPEITDGSPPNGQETGANNDYDVSCPTTTTIWYRDADEDGYGNPDESVVADEQPEGYVADNTDCDDEDKNTNPAATEVCNDGKDNNCDGKTDDCNTGNWWYRDLDGDAWGSLIDSVQAEEQPEGYVAKRGDCNDNNANIHPGAKGSCNGIDDNCDGLVDEACTGPTWYRDADGDGWGNPADSTRYPTQPRGYVSNNGDCNDKNKTKGGPEVCDGRDNDCDGIIDDGLAKTTFYSDFDGDGYGTPKRTITACAAPPRYVSNSLDRNDDNKNVYPGAPEICDGRDNNGDGVIDEGFNKTTFYHDFDKDGYGREGVTLQACAAPLNYAARAGDCNDRDRDVHPGGPALCDGKDNDCDGRVDENCNPVTSQQSARGKAPVEQGLQLQLSAAPNPATHYFTLRITGNNSKTVELRVVDEVGRVVEARRNLAANTTVTVGHGYRAGVYHAQALQGGKYVSVKLVKTSR